MTWERIKTAKVNKIVPILKGLTEREIDEILTAVRKLECVEAPLEECPECGHELTTDRYNAKVKYCDNEDCSLYINRINHYSLIFRLP